MTNKLNDIITNMTLAEKASLCSGENYWKLKSIGSYDIPHITICDGPCGLNKKKSSFSSGISEKSSPATCFPAPSALACSWDRTLLSKIGKAVAEECKQASVSCILAPAVNIKRFPLSGRNHEYFSEDPFLTGELAVGYVNGIQSEGVGACVKHFAANNQENRRMLSDSIIDERTLREIYLSAFEKVIIESKPLMIMAAYNKLNGRYCTENKHLLSKILREEWGFCGVTVSDWGAVNHRIDSMLAGLDLEMPGRARYNTEQLLCAIEDGVISEAVLNRSVENILSFILKSIENKVSDYKYDKEDHNRIAREAAVQSAVLLKNSDKILPIAKTAQVVLIGEFAKSPVISGAGSCSTNPNKISCAYDEMFAQEISFTYADGYNIKDDNPNDELIAEACKKAKNAEVAIIYAGLAYGYESEGFDRISLNLPESQNALIKAVASVNPNTVVILHGGSPVLMPWIDDVKAVLMMYMSGQAGGAASVDLIFGRYSPCGKLAETFPLALSDVPCSQYVSAMSNTAEYRECLFVGYRYYTSAEKPVLFPFGYGLSYANFKYSCLRISKNDIREDDEILVSFKIKNVSDFAAAEIAELYIHKKDSVIIRPQIELKEFAKVYLKPGEEQDVIFNLSKRAFAFYSTDTNSFEVESGTYSIKVGSSCLDIQLEIDANVHSTNDELMLPDLREICPSYYNLNSHEHFIASASEFEKLSQIKSQPVYSEDKKFDLGTSLGELVNNKNVSSIIRKIIKHSDNTRDKDMPDLLKIQHQLSFINLPLYALVNLSNGKLTHKSAEGLIQMANGKKVSGFFKFLNGRASK